MNLSPLFAGFSSPLPLFLAQAAPASSASSDTISELSSTSNLLQMISNAGWVMVPLIFASVVTFTLILYCLFTLHLRSITTPEMMARMEPFLENEDLEGLASYVAERPQATARVIDQTLRFLERCPDADGSAIKAVAEVEASRVVANFSQRVAYIMDVGVLAPMLGLFGTVVGILTSFGQIAQNQGPARTLVLAGGVSTALISTAVGLIIGITAMVFYAIFRGRLNQLVSVLETESTLLVQELIIINRRAKNGTPAATRE